MATEVSIRYSGYRCGWTPSIDLPPVLAGKPTGLVLGAGTVGPDYSPPKPDLQARYREQTESCSAMASGNATGDEMFEFVLQYAIHAGRPRASVVQGAVMEKAGRIEKGLPLVA